eukprot:jgi/Mesvir1/25180/Mv19740-RA.1
MEEQIYGFSAYKQGLSKRVIDDKPIAQTLKKDRSKADAYQPYAKVPLIEAELDKAAAPIPLAADLVQRDKARAAKAAKMAASPTPHTAALDAGPTGGGTCSTSHGSHDVVDVRVSSGIGNANDHMGGASAAAMPERGAGSVEAAISERRAIRAMWSHEVYLQEDRSQVLDDTEVKEAVEDHFANLRPDGSEHRTRQWKRLSRMQKLPTEEPPAEPVAGVQAQADEATIMDEDIEDH